MTAEQAIARSIVKTLPDGRQTVLEGLGPVFEFIEYQRADGVWIRTVEREPLGCGGHRVGRGVLILGEVAAPRSARFADVPGLDRVRRWIRVQVPTWYRTAGGDLRGQMRAFTLGVGWV